MMPLAGQFGALPLGYGEMEPVGSNPAASTNKDEYTAAALTIAQMVGAGISGASSTPEELRARIANLQGMKRRIPALAIYYDNQIAKLQARLVALQRVEKRSATWRGLGQAGLGVGIFLGFSLSALALSSALRSGR